MLRRDWLPAAVVILMLALPKLLSGSLPGAIGGLVWGSLIVLAFFRFGLLTVAASFVISFWLNGLLFMTNLSAWYASTQFPGMFIVTALAAFAFYTSPGGQQVFKGNLLED